MSKIRHRLLFIGVCWLVVHLLLLGSLPIEHFVDVVKHRATKVDLPLSVEDELLSKIQEWRSTYEEPPVDTAIDPSWEAAVPGYNGKRIDADASIAQMKSTGVHSPDQLIFKQVPPAKSIDQFSTYPIYRGNPQKPAISFMINVAWGNEYLDSILATLDKYNIKTTFFFDGSWVKRYPEEAKKIAQRGHEIGNHAYSHPNMEHLNDSQIRQEIGKTQQIIQKTIGTTPTLFAPPSGSFSKRVVSIAAAEFQMKTILWTADTIDWKNPSNDTLIRRINKKMGNGVLVLMHPTRATSESLEALIKQAKKMGLTPTTVSEVISSRRLDMP